MAQKVISLFLCCLWIRLLNCSFYFTLSYTKMLL